MLFSCILVNTGYSQIDFENTLVFNNITKEDGLPNEYVNPIAEDDHGFIWIENFSLTISKNLDKLLEPEKAEEMALNGSLRLNSH